MLNSKKGEANIPVDLADVVLTAIMLVVGFTSITFVIANIESQTELLTDNIEYKILANRLLTNCIAYQDTTSGFKPGWVHTGKLNKFNYDSCFGADVEYTISIYEELSSTPSSTISTGGTTTVKDTFPVIIVSPGIRKPANIVVELGFK